jgi:acyl carrier protein
MNLEREFNVKFSEEDTSQVQTVGDVYALIEKYIKKS